MVDRVIVRQKIRDAFSNPQRLRSFLLRYYPAMAQQHSGTLYDPMVNDLLTHEFNEQMLLNIVAFTQTCPEPPDNERGLYQKYNIVRTDGKSIDPKDRYFILQYNRSDAQGSAARIALELYCNLVAETHPLLVEELRADLKLYTLYDSQPTS